MKLIKKLIKFFAILFLLLLALPLVLYIPLLFDRNFYKDLITQNVENYSDYKLSLNQLNLAVYPDLRLSLQEVELKTKKEEIQIEYCDKLPTEKEQIECKIELYEKLLKELKISMRFCEDESKRKECLNFIRKRATVFFSIAQQPFKIR